MKTTHTPGPWHINPLGTNGSLFEADVNTADGITVAICKAATREQTEANARLIAAAPDLLEALECALPELESVPTGDWDEGHIENHKAVIAIVRAALTKSQEGGR